MISNFTRSLVAISILIFPYPAFAVDEMELSRAAQLLELGNAPEALELLEASHVLEAASVQELFLLGIAAKKSGAFSQSESYFRQAIAKDANAGRIKLELAEVLAIQGKFDEANNELQSVLALNPPEEVKENIRSFIAQIEIAKTGRKVDFAGREPEKSWNGYVGVGISYDSNVNASTDSDSVSFFGLPFTLSDDAQETDDGAWNIRAGYTHRWLLSEKAVWDIGVHGSFTDYFTVDTYDNLSLSAEAGPGVALSEKAFLSLPLTVNTQSFTDTSEDFFSVFYGVAPRLHVAARDELEFRLNTGVSRKVYVESRERDSIAWNVAPSMRWKPFEEVGYFNAGLNYGRENSGEDIFSNDVFGGYLGYEHKFQDDRISASVTASYSDLNFDGVQAAQSEAREDQSYSLSGSLSYKLRPIENSPITDNTIISLDASYTDNQSNLEINDYDRTQIRLTFTKKFWKTVITTESPVGFCPVSAFVN